MKITKEKIINQYHNRTRQEDPGTYRRGASPDGHRPDTMPEAHFGSGEYQDKGCTTGGLVIPSCLACPLPECKYDNPSQRSEQQNTRDQAIYQLLTKGKRKVAEIAVEYNISTRTVHRIRTRGKKS